jgi:hypothetical protein
MSRAIKTESAPNDAIRNGIINLGGEAHDVVVGGVVVERENMRTAATTNSVYLICPSPLITLNPYREDLLIWSFYLFNESRSVRRQVHELLA